MSGSIRVACINAQISYSQPAWIRNLAEQLSKSTGMEQLHSEILRAVPPITHFHAVISLVVRFSVHKISLTFPERKDAFVGTWQHPCRSALKEMWPLSCKFRLHLFLINYFSEICLNPVSWLPVNNGRTLFVQVTESLIVVPVSALRCSCCGWRFPNTKEWWCQQETRQSETFQGNGNLSLFWETNCKTHDATCKNLYKLIHRDEQRIPLWKANTKAAQANSSFSKEPV